MQHKHKNSHTWINLGLDVALVAAFLVSFKPLLTGLAVHEWLGLAVGAALVVHVILHHKWIAGVTKKLFKSSTKTRVYYTVDVSLAITFTTILISGVAMSRAILPLFGLSGSTSPVWFNVHKLSSLLTLVLLGIKLVLHRKWFVAVFKKLGRRHKKASNIQTRSSSQSA